MEELFSREGKIPKGMLILAPAVAFLIILGMGTYSKSNAPQVGDKVPSFSGPLLIGDGELSLADLAGQPAVINFWASWCAPCKDEAPLLTAAADRYAGQIQFVGIDVRDARGDALEFVEEYGLDWPHVRDEGSAIYAQFGLTGQPETFFIDGDGVLVKHVKGPVDEETLGEILDVLVRRSA